MQREGERERGREKERRREGERRERDNKKVLTSLFFPSFKIKNPCRVVRVLEVDQQEAIRASMTWAAGERLNTAE